MNKSTTLAKEDIVYGGYCHFPDHPLADLHGIVRFCIKTNHPFSVETALEKYGVHLDSRSYGKIWGPSKSRIEQEVSAHAYGEVYFTTPATAYLSKDSYHFDRKMTLPIRQETDRLAHTEGSKVKAGGPAKRRVDFP